MNIHDQHITSQELKAWINGELSNVKNDEIKSHLTICEMCSDITEGMIKFDNKKGLRTTYSELQRKFEKKHFVKKTNSMKFPFLNLNKNNIMMIITGILLAIMIGMLFYSILSKKDPNALEMQKNIDAGLMIDSLLLIESRTELTDDSDINKHIDSTMTFEQLYKNLEKEKLKELNNSSELTQFSNNDKTEGSIPQYAQKNDFESITNGFKFTNSFDRTADGGIRYSKKRENYSANAIYEANKNDQYENDEVEVVYYKNSDYDKTVSFNHSTQPKKSNALRNHIIPNSSSELNQIEKKFYEGQYSDVVKFLELNSHLDYSTNYSYHYFMAFSLLKLHKRNEALPFIEKLVNSSSKYYQWAKSQF